MSRFLIVAGLLLILVASCLAGPVVEEEPRENHPGGALVTPGGEATPEPTPEPEPTTPEPVEEETEETTDLSQVRVLDQPLDGYDRDAFGTPWYDEDGNGCDTRHDILARDVDGAEIAPHGCTVVSGTLEDPYTGKEVSYSVDDGRDVHIDHVVSLSKAWGGGAGSWSENERRAFANDPDNLLAVEGSVNMSKGDSGPSEWLPEVDRCDYADRYVDVHVEYDLGMPRADYDALEALSCG